MDSVTLPLPALPSATHRPLWNPRTAVAGFRCFHSSAPLSRLRGSPLLASNTLTANSVPPKSGVYTVGDFMTKKEDLHVVKPTTTVDEALEALVEHRITGFPVIDDNWKLVGVVSDYDLLALDSISGQGRKDTSMFPEVDSTWKELQLYSAMESVRRTVNFDVNFDDEAVSETPFTVFGSTETPKKTMSDVWNHFTKTGKDAKGYDRATCNYCSHSYKIGKNPKSNNNYGTSHLSRHLPVCKGMDVHQDGLTNSMRKINLNIHRELLAEAIIQHDLPFSFVEYERVRKWINYLNPDAEMTCRNTAVSDVEKIYTIEKDKVKEMMSKIPNRVCLTSDGWTAVTGEGYICLTAHFVDESWKLVSKILNFCRVKPPHGGSELEATLFDCLKEWGIDKKVFSITLDNASANDSMQSILKTHLCVQSNLLCDGEFFHIRCSAHILNLIVQEGLKVASGALNKIRDSIRYVKQSDGRMLKFKECVKDAGISMTIGLRTDVSIRWNSTYLMLESALEYQKAFDYFKVADRNYKCCPSDEEWRRGEKICEFLEPFYDITCLISGSSYPTSSLYFMQVWKIQLILEGNQSNEDDVIREMSVKMKEKFDKYWKDYSVVLAFGAILDPRLKIAFLNYCYKGLDASTFVDKVNRVREKIDKLYGEYVSISTVSNVSLSQSSNDTTLFSNPRGEGTKSKRSKIATGFNAF